MVDVWKQLRSDLDSFKTEDRIKTDFPMWYCPVYACPYRTEYVKNIGQHLGRVHGFANRYIRKELDHFWKCKEDGVRVICSKAEDDPTRPRSLGMSNSGLLLLSLFAFIVATV